MMKKLAVPALALLIGCQGALAQPGGGPDGSRSPREAAPIALEGYWVSVVTEDWMFRMVTPPKGETGGVPLNREGRRVADAWDPQADIARGEQCKAYGAPALMRIPGRILASWENDSVLKIETEAGMQTRYFQFGEPREDSYPDPRQGVSSARWENYPGPDGSGKLVVETAGFQPGYLRKNGVPYSADARLTEYYTVYDAPNGDTWLVITTEVEDPQYLNAPFVTSSHFKKLDDREGERYWNPQECEAM